MFSAPKFLLCVLYWSGITASDETDIKPTSGDRMA